MKTIVEIITRTTFYKDGYNMGSNLVIKTITYHGNILFRKGFTNKLFTRFPKNSVGAFHFLGFRFTVGVANYDYSYVTSNAQFTNKWVLVIYKTRTLNK